MERYTWIELADMNLAYGATFTSGRAAQRLYRDRYPNRRITHHTTFSNIHRRLCQSETVQRRVDGQGRRRFVWTPEAEEAVLQYVENNTSMSTGDTARHFHMSHATIWRILQEILLRPYQLWHQLSIHPECTSLIGIWTRAYSKQTCRDGTKNWIHPDSATLEWAFFF